MPTIKRKLTAAINCASYGWNPSGWYFIVGPTDLDIGHITYDTYKQGNALRFLNIDIPPGQVIKNAFITYYAWAPYNVDDCNAYLYGEKSLIPNSFSTWFDFEARPKTANLIPWNQIPHWQDPNPYNTPNIAPVIQEIISQPGWVAGSPIALFCDDLANRSTHISLATRHAWAYYEHFEWAPELTIEYGPESNFAVLDISYRPTLNSIIITLPTQIPCHLICYYTDTIPLKHKDTRFLRGASMPWGAYFCFVAWKSVEQQEAGDTLTHTFEVPDWSYCQTKWFTIRGQVNEVDSPSVGPVFEKHHPGISQKEFTLRVSHNYDNYRRVKPYLYQACPDNCPPVLWAGRITGYYQGMGLRFRDVPLPPLCTINEAYLIITPPDNTNMACGTRISAERVLNPPDFSTDNYAIALTRWLNRTAARTEWDFTPFDIWVKDSEYHSPDISPTIQELVNLDFWQEGNAIALFWDDWDEETLPPSNYRPAYPHHLAPGKSVKLHVKYTS